MSSSTNLKQKNVISVQRRWFRPEKSKRKYSQFQAFTHLRPFLSHIIVSITLNLGKTRTPCKISENFLQRFLGTTPGKRKNRQTDGVYFKRPSLCGSKIRFLTIKVMKGNLKLRIFYKILMVVYILNYLHASTFAIVRITSFTM